MTASRIAISGGATPAEAAAALACVELLLAEQAVASESAPGAGRSPWWHEGLAAALDRLPPDREAPFVTETG